jgi:hypothetical protein
MQHGSGKVPGKECHVSHVAFPLETSTLSAFLLRIDSLSIFVSGSVLDLSKNHNPGRPANVLGRFPRSIRRSQEKNEIIAITHIYMFLSLSVSLSLYIYVCLLIYLDILHFVSIFGAWCPCRGAEILINSRLPLNKQADITSRCRHIVSALYSPRSKTPTGVADNILWL